MFNSFPQPKPDSGGSNIKSIQRGKYTITSVNNANIALSEVNITKAIVRIRTSPTSTTTDTVNENAVKAELTSGINLNLSRRNLSGEVEIYWEVIEYNNVKSLQKGSLSLAATSSTITISAVNLNKAILEFSYDGGLVTTNIYDFLVSGGLTGSTELTFEQMATGSMTINWQVIEFL